MTRLTPLPTELATSYFRVARARELGVSPSRLRARGLERPYWGVRGADDATIDPAHAFAPRLSDGQCFSGATAARLWGLPLPGWLNREPELCVGVPHHRSRRRQIGVVTHEFDPRRFRVLRLDELPILEPLATAVVLARSLDRVSLIAIADALQTPARNYPGLRLPRLPYLATSTVLELLESWERVPGVGALRRAFDESLPGVESQWETRLRTVLHDAGISGLDLQHTVMEHGRIVAVLDLALVALKIDIEYEGDHHRTDSRQWDRDIERQRALERLGWTVIRVTRRDLIDNGRLVVRRVHQAIADRRSRQTQ